MTSPTKAVSLVVVGKAIKKQAAKKTVAAKGKKVVVLDLAKDADAMERLAEVVLGPTGNLRAPSARVGKNWLIGFSEDEYAKAFS
mgnify:CR=1 FL=1